MNQIKHVSLSGKANQDGESHDISVSIVPEKYNFFGKPVAPHQIMQEEVCGNISTILLETPNTITLSTKEVENASPDVEGRDHEKEVSKIEAPEVVDTRNTPPLGDPVHKKIWDSISYSSISSIGIGGFAMLGASHAMNQYSYLVTLALYEQYPILFEESYANAMELVSHLETGVIVLIFVASFLFAKYRSVARNPYIQKFGSSLRLESQIYKNSSELHFFAEKDFYNEAQNSTDKATYIGRNIMRDLLGIISRFESNGIAKRAGGEERIQEIVIHSPLLDESRAARIKRIIAGSDTLECSIEAIRMKNYGMERAAFLTSKNLLLPFPLSLVAKIEQKFNPKSSDILLSQDWIFRTPSWVVPFGPKNRSLIVAATGMLIGNLQMIQKAIHTVVHSYLPRYIDAPKELPLEKLYYRANLRLKEKKL